MSAKMPANHRGRDWGASPVENMTDTGDSGVSEQNWPLSQVQVEPSNHFSTDCLGSFACPSLHNSPQNTKPPWPTPRLERRSGSGPPTAQPHSFAVCQYSPRSHCCTYCACVCERPACLPARVRTCWPPVDTSLLRESPPSILAVRAMSTSRLGTTHGRSRPTQRPSICSPPTRSCTPTGGGWVVPLRLPLPTAGSRRPVTP
jgi:hypothetical protein